MSTLFELILLCSDTIIKIIYLKQENSIPDFFCSRFFLFWLQKSIFLGVSYDCLTKNHTKISSGGILNPPPLYTVLVSTFWYFVRVLISTEFIDYKIKYFSTIIIYLSYHAFTIKPELNISFYQ